MDPFAEVGAGVPWHSRTPWAITGEEWSRADAGGEGDDIDEAGATARASASRTHARTPGVRPSWQLTERDGDVLRWMTRHGMVTRAQVAARFFPSQDMAKKRIRKLVDLGLISSRVTRRGAPEALLVTRAGVRVCNSPLSPPKFSLAEYDHAVAVVDLLEQLLITYPDASLITERELRREQGSARREGRPTLARIPDGVLAFADGRRVAVELDRRSKSRTVRITIIRNYLLADFSVVWWYCISERLAAGMQSLVEEQYATHLIRVGVWPS